MFNWGLVSVNARANDSYHFYTHQTPLCCICIHFVPTLIYSAFSFIHLSPDCISNCSKWSCLLVFISVIVYRPVLLKACSCSCGWMFEFHYVTMQNYICAVNIRFLRGGHTSMICDITNSLKANWSDCQYTQIWCGNLKLAVQKQVGQICCPDKLVIMMQYKCHIRITNEIVVYLVCVHVASGNWGSSETKMKLEHCKRPRINKMHQFKQKTGDNDIQQ